MKVKILDISDDTVSFIVEGINVALANALRRTMIKEVPCMTIDDLFIFDNSSIWTTIFFLKNVNVTAIWGAANVELC